MYFCPNCLKEIKEQPKCPFCGYEIYKYQSSPRHLPLNTILNGKYLIGRVIGEGGFGITYYYVITGKSIPNAYERMNGSVFQKPSKLGVRISPRQEQALIKGLELSVHKRIQNIAELKKSLGFVSDSNHHPRAVHLVGGNPTRKGEVALSVASLGSEWVIVVG
ncbi:MAG: hypothetical protein ACI39W_09940 [Brotaphodocola sp.]